MSNSIYDNLDPSFQDNFVTNAWIYPVIISSALLFLLVSFRLTRGPKYREKIGFFGFVSALADLISASITTANVFSPPINLNAIFLLHGIQYVFAFFVVLFAFNHIIKKRQGDGISLVYLGFVWGMVTLIISCAVTIILRDTYWFYDHNAIDVYNLMMLILNAIWGFVAIIIALFFLNKKHFIKRNKNSMQLYITLVLVAAITTLIIIFTEMSHDATEGVSFFLIDLPMKIALFLSVYYGPHWITEFPDDKFTDTQALSNGLETV